MKLFIVSSVNIVLLLFVQVNGQSATTKIDEDAIIKTTSDTNNLTTLSDLNKDSMEDNPFNTVPEQPSNNLLDFTRTKKSNKSLPPPPQQYPASVCVQINPHHSYNQPPYVLCRGTTNNNYQNMQPSYGHNGGYKPTSAQNDHVYGGGGGGDNEQYHAPIHYSSAEMYGSSGEKYHLPSAHNSYYLHSETNGYNGPSYGPIYNNPSTYGHSYNGYENNNIHHTYGNPSYGGYSHHETNNNYAPTHETAGHNGNNGEHYASTHENKYHNVPPVHAYSSSSYEPHPHNNYGGNNHMPTPSVSPTSSSASYESSYSNPYRPSSYNEPTSYYQPQNLYIPQIRCGGNLVMSCHPTVTPVPCSSSDSTSYTPQYNTQQYNTPPYSEPLMPTNQPPSRPPPPPPPPQSYMLYNGVTQVYRTNENTDDKNSTSNGMNDKKPGVIVQPGYTETSDLPMKPTMSSSPEQNNNKNNLQQPQSQQRQDEENKEELARKQADTMKKMAQMALMLNKDQQQQLQKQLQLQQQKQLDQLEDNATVESSNNTGNNNNKNNTSDTNKWAIKH